MKKNQKKEKLLEEEIKVCNTINFIEDKKHINTKHELDQLQEEIYILEQAICDAQDEIEEKNKYIEMEREEMNKRISEASNK